MDKKEMQRCQNWLKRGFQIEKEIKFLKKEQQRALEEKEKNGALGNQAVFYAKRLAEQMEALFCIRLELFELMVQLEKSTHRLLLSLRYLSSLTWEEIAEIMEVDVRHVYRLHKEALAQVMPMILDK